MKLAPVVSIIGPEGAGKSTTVANVSSFLASQTIPYAVIFMGRGKGNIVPFPRFGGKEGKYGENKSLPKTTFKKRIMYSLAVCLLTVDFQLRYLFHIFPQRWQKRIVITDRYTTDLYNMYHTPCWLRKIALTLFPKPTLTFYLYNDIGVLYQRKGRSQADLQWQLDNFTFLNRKFNAVEIKTDGEKETLEIIKKEMEKKGLIK